MAGSEINEIQDSGEKRGLFPVTHWTEIAAISAPDHPEAQAALENLCVTYLPAIEGYLRRAGSLPGEPHELATVFLGNFIHADAFKRLDRRKGKFRSYLIGAIRNFVREEWRRKLRRPEAVELDEQNFPDGADNEAVARFDRDVAELLVKNAVKRLHERFAGSKLQSQIPILMPYLTIDPPTETLRQLAARMAVTEDLVYQNFKRLRDEFNQQLLKEAAKLVGPDDSVEEELAALLRVYAHD